MGRNYLQKGERVGERAKELLIIFPGFLEQGLIVKDTRRLAAAYIHSMQFKFDIFSLLPTDLLYFVPGDWLALPTTFFRYRPLGNEFQ
jgi:hypothetical protein